MGCGLDMRRVLPVSVPAPPIMLYDSHLASNSEANDPLDVAFTLLRESSARPPPNIQAIYLLAVTKIFGYWALNQANNWRSELLPDVRATIDRLVSLIGKFLGDADAEVQERVCANSRIPLFLPMKYSVARQLRSFNSFSLSRPRSSLFLVTKLMTKIRLSSPRACILSIRFRPLSS